MKNYLGLFCGLFLIVAVVTTVSTYITYNSRFTVLTEDYRVTQNFDTVVFTNMWANTKEIISRSGVEETTTYEESFRQLYFEFMWWDNNDSTNTRYARVSNWFHYHTISIAPHDYILFINKLELRRLVFRKNQEKLQRLNTEILRLTTTFPGTMFLRGRTFTMVGYQR